MAMRSPAFVKIEMMPPRAGEKDSTREQRDEKLQLLLAMLHKVDAAQDKTFDPAKDSPQLNIAPPAGPNGPFYNSGLSPDVIADPVIRAEYLRRIAENRQKITRWNREIPMREERDSLVSIIVEYAKRFELTPTDKSFLQQEIDAHLKEPKLNAEVKERIKGKEKIAPKESEELNMTLSVNARYHRV